MEGVANTAESVNPVAPHYAVRGQVDLLPEMSSQ